MRWSTLASAGALAVALGTVWLERGGAEDARPSRSPEGAAMPEKPGQMPAKPGPKPGKSGAMPAKPESNPARPGSAAAVQPVEIKPSAKSAVQTSPGQPADAAPSGSRSSVRERPAPETASPAEVQAGTRPTMRRKPDDAAVGNSIRRETSGSTSTMGRSEPRPRAAVLPEAQAAAAVDALIDAAQLQAGIEPLPVCTDVAFLRRVWLDLAGRIPPVAVVAAVADRDEPLDRGAVIDELLESHPHASHWGRMWAEHLTGLRPFEQDGYDGRVLQRWVREAWEKNVPYDELARALLMGEGSSDVSGPANFLLRYEAEPIPLAGAVSQKFLGLTLQCAECHNHPHARWTERDFWGFAAHFARLRRMTPTNPQPNEQFTIVVERPRGELLVIDKKSMPDPDGNYPTRTVFPQLPGDSEVHMAEPRRTALLDWMTADENPYFARNAVNQVWYRLTGAKLVDSLDQWKADDPALAAQVLSLLADDFRTSGYDMRRLLRVVALTKVYQRAVSQPHESPHLEASVRDRELELYARGRIRPLTADQLHFSIAEGTGYSHDDNDERLAQLTGDEFTYDLPVNSFGETPSSMRRAIALYGSEHIRGAANLASERVMRLYGEAAGAAHVERLFVSLLSRRPTRSELTQFLTLAGADMPKAGLEDVAWVLLNSAEFNTNH